MRKRKSFSVKIKLCVIIFICFSFIIAATVLFITKASPVFIKKAGDASEAEISELISEASKTAFEDSFEKESYSLTDNINDATILTADTEEINFFRFNFTKALTDMLKNNETKYIFIPFGSIFNNPLTQGSGVKIPIKVCYSTVPKINIESNVTTSGINQVKYSVYLKVSVSITVISANISENRIVESIVPVYEHIIIGKTPNYYNGKLNN